MTPSFMGMSAGERFIDIATAPLADENAELHLAARHILQETIDPTDEGAIHAAVERLPSSKPRRWPFAVLMIAMATLSLPILLWSAAELRSLRAMRSLATFAPIEAVRDLGGLSPEDRRRLTGKIHAPDEASRWKPLWESRPDHPPYFLRYARAYIMENDELPPDFLETAERIDPDNGWYWLMAAGMESLDNLARDSPSGIDAEKRVAPRWTIEDIEKHRRSIRLLKVAASKPRLDSYLTDLLEERAGLLPPAGDYTDQIIRAAYLYQIEWGLAPPMNASRAIAAEAERCGAAGDLAGYQQIAAVHQAISPKLIRSSGTTLELLIARSTLSQPLKNLRDAAIQLDRPDEARGFSHLDVSMAPTPSERRRRLAAHEPNDRLLERKASLLVGLQMNLTLHQTLTPLPLSEEDLAPDRRAFQALLDRGAALLTWMVLGVAFASVAFYRFRHAAVLHSLSVRFVQLLGVSDWCWILVGGIIAPLSWFWIISQLSPLAAHHWNPKFTAFALPAGQSLATLLLLLITPTVLARWRLSRRAGFAGFRIRRPWIGIMAVASAAITLPLVGLAPQLPPQMSRILVASVILIALALLWLLAVAVGGMFRNSSRALQRQALAVVLRPAYAFGMLLVVSSLPVFHAVEKHWMSMDTMSQPSTEDPWVSEYEHRLNRQLKAEILEMIRSAR